MHAMKAGRVIGIHQRTYLFYHYNSRASRKKNIFRKVYTL